MGQNKSLVLCCCAGRQIANWPEANEILQRQKDMYLYRFGVQEYS